MCRKAGLINFNQTRRKGRDWKAKLWPGVFRPVAITDASWFSRWFIHCGAPFSKCTKQTEGRGMQKAKMICRAFAIAAAIGFLATSCSTAEPAVTERSHAPSAQLFEHQRKQKIRFEEGHYKRLYRPRICRGRPNWRSLSRHRQHAAQATVAIRLHLGKQASPVARSTPAPRCRIAQRNAVMPVCLVQELPLRLVSKRNQTRCSVSSIQFSRTLVLATSPCSSQSERVSRMLARRSALSSRNSASMSCGST